MFNLMPPAKAKQLRIFLLLHGKPMPFASEASYSAQWIGHPFLAKLNLLREEWTSEQVLKQDRSFQGLLEKPIRANG